MELAITGKNAEKLTAALWQKITEAGFNALSKNDFYDYVLYLFNKYDNNHFLDANSNYTNSILLRVPPQKVKSSKHNIFLKYKEDSEKNTALQLFQKIADNAIALQLDAAKKEYTLTVEDRVMRDYLDGLLKRVLNKTFNYQENHENIVLAAADFYRIFSAALEEMRALPNADAAAIEAKISALKKDGQKKLLISAAVKSAVKILAIAAPLPVKEIVEAAKGFVS